METSSDVTARDVVRARRRLRTCGAALARLEASYHALARCPVAEPRSDGRVPLSRLAGIVAWRRSYDALHARGVRAMSPDGSIVEVSLGEGRVTLERSGDGDAWVPRSTVPRRADGPLRSRFPWVRVI